MLDMRRETTDQILILDGAMGTMLQAKGLKSGENPEVLNLTAPGIVKEVHTAYLQRGSKAILTNTFGANEHKLARTGYSVEEIVAAAVAIAKDAAKPFGAYVGLDMGSLGELLEPMGDLSFEAAYKLFQRQIIQGVKSGVDFISTETMTDLYEVKAALLAAKENSDLPVFCTMTFEKNMRTYTGCSIPSMALTLEGLGADAIGINCSLGPVEILPMAEELAKWTSLPLIIKPNAGLPEIVDGETVFHVAPEEFGHAMEAYLKTGVSIMGGCCGTNPEFIASLKNHVGQKTPAKRVPQIPLAVCTGSRHVLLSDAPAIHLFTPEGNEDIRKALLDEDFDTITDYAMDAADDAELLGIHVHTPGADEKKLLPAVVSQLQKVIRIPFILDSRDPDAFGAALRVYNGRAGVFTPEEENCRKACEKYGAAILPRQ